MVRMLVLTLVCLNLVGCEALTQFNTGLQAGLQGTTPQEQAQREQGLRDRVAALTPEQKDAVQRCYSESVGRIKALRNANQGASTNGMNDYTVTDACLNNHYFYATIPAPRAVVNNPSMTCTAVPSGMGPAQMECN
jgi:hypothetical protein